MSGLNLKSYFSSIFNKNEEQDDFASFQETDPKRQRAFDNMTDDQKKKYLERKVRDIKYITKRQNFINIVVEEFDKGVTDEEFENIMKKVSKVYGNTQMIDIFSSTHYYKLKSQLEVTPLFEMLDNCYNVNNEILKEKVINWLFNKVNKKEVKWEIIIGLCHCEYFNYDTIDLLIDVIDKHIVKVENGVLNNECLDKISSLIIPSGYSMAGQSFLSKWVAVARAFNDYESIQKILNAGFKINYKASGKDEVLLNTVDDGMLQFDIDKFLEKIDRFFMENARGEGKEFEILKNLRKGYKHTLLHKMFLDFNDKDSDLLLVNRIKPDVGDIMFFNVLFEKNFNNKKILSFLNQEFPEGKPLTIRLRQSVNLIKEFLSEEERESF